jgi:hypothetical protein
MMAGYTHGIVTFLDMLGFGAIVENGAPPDEILAMLEAVKKAAFQDADAKRILRIEYLCISDCMIRSLEISHPQKVPAPELQQELLDLVHMQCELIWKGYPVRGAVTHGKIYFKGRTLFGPAYQKAYVLEQQAAAPRIVIDDNVIGDFIGYPEGRGDLDFGNAREELHGQIRRDTDGKWFLDYLRSIQTEIEYDEDYYKLLVAHRDLIRNRMILHSGMPKILSKYQWMKTYHDAVVDEIREDWFAEGDLKREDVRV